jgi:thiamine-monophosphate kinase
MQTLSELGEFGLIERITRLAGRRSWPQVVIGIGDDAAVLRLRAGEDLVVSTDAAVEDVHFRWSTASPRVIGRRALVANLSDLAAMGARPLGFTLALQAPPHLAVRTFEGVLAGMLDEARRHACPLVGGNVTRARQTSLAITVMGAAKQGRALRRDALEPGDRLFVTGVLGASALALARAKQRGTKLRHVPHPRLAAGRALGRMHGCGACIDVSDGLVADLGHLLEASGVGAEIDPSLLPRPRGFDRACQEIGKDPERLLLRGGEDYELIFSLRAAAGARLGKSVLERRLGARVTEFGRVEATPGLRGAASDGGWRHF